MCVLRWIRLKSRPSPASSAPSKLRPLRNIQNITKLYHPKQSTLWKPHDLESTPITGSDLSSSRAFKGKVPQRLLWVQHRHGRLFLRCASTALMFRTCLKENCIHFHAYGTGVGHPLNRRQTIHPWLYQEFVLQTYITKLRTILLKSVPLVHSKLRALH